MYPGKIWLIYYFGLSISVRTNQIACPLKRKIFFITTELIFLPAHSFRINLSIFSYRRVSTPSLLGGIREQVCDREGMVSNAACLETDADRPVFRVEKLKSSWRLLGCLIGRGEERAGAWVWGGKDGLLWEQTWPEEASWLQEESKGAQFSSFEWLFCNYWYWQIY